MRYSMTNMMYPSDVDRVNGGKDRYIIHRSCTQLFFFREASSRRKREFNGPARVRKRNVSDVSHPRCHGVRNSELNKNIYTKTSSHSIHNKNIFSNHEALLVREVTKSDERIKYFLSSN